MAKKAAIAVAEVEVPKPTRAASLVQTPRRVAATRVKPETEEPVGEMDVNPILPVSPPTEEDSHLPAGFRRKK